ncbi:DUF1345 domain-containing protein [Roseiarcaceae bacterium H3SJ34-1]|uniref:DUF1345 domain-containing protein n=1 Tax=Terripilifer ovatus TaxID=3032367 RepID=UPI003AB93AA8|nr:DUF1345 domain-containing protein [Roseiarcaceae bacterium H3SJ34-1]
MTEGTMVFRNMWLRNLYGRVTLIVCFTVGVICYFLLPSDWRFALRLLSAWNLAAWLYIGLLIHAMSRATEASIRRRAEQLDEGRFAALALSILAAVTAMAALVSQISAARDASGLAKGLHLGLAGLTIVTSWTFIHLVFAHHYAHEFYIQRDSEAELAKEDRGGLRFPGDQRPTFADFAYFSFIIGVACQTADVSITSRPMRKLNLIHAILAFIFNTAILALTINIAASLLSGS